jgi:signal transduction histidine kinase
MKSMMKILTRYVLSAAGVAIVLLIVNFSALTVWTVQAGKSNQRSLGIGQISDGLILTGGAYALSKSAENEIDRLYQWALLIGNDGNVAWSRNLPEDVPVRYALPDAAGFSRWYLNDYPVYVWTRPDGLFVLGAPKGSRWKYSVDVPQPVMDNMMVWLPAILALNAATAILLALGFGVRLFRSMKPLAQGIEDMAGKQPVTLPVRGPLGTLANGINKTSERLIRQEADLSRRDSARTEWIAGVSHDIRTPLSLVMGYASQLENDESLPPEARERAVVIRSQSERIKSLVSDLNLASKLEYAMQPLRLADVAPAALLRGIAADFLNGGLDLRYTLDIKISESAQNAVITGDEALLRRAVSNLVINSVRHNPDGCEIKLMLKRDSGNCRIAVRDNGKGFRLDTLQALNHPLPTAALESHGLGLVIARQIAKAHGGTMEIRNLAEGGCEVVLCLAIL